MAEELGCVVDYQVIVADRGGVRLVADLPFTALTWSRRREGVSTARVTVPTSGPGCCRDVSGLRTWRHELVLLRNGERVWEGPIVDLTYGRNSVDILAHDVLGWLARRAVRDRLCFSPECGGSATDASSVAARIIEHAITPADPLFTVDTRPTGIIVDRTIEAHSAYALDAIGNLAQAGLRFTAIGRRVLLFGGELARTHTLTCQHFRTDISVVEAGLATATRVFIRGEAVVGEAGGVDPYFGLVEQIIQNDLASAQSAADQAAAFVADTLAPPLLLVQVPQGAALAPAAPVTIDRLVPGVGIPVDVTCVCRDVRQTLQLTGIDVSVVGGESGSSGEGETVGVFLSPEAVSTE